MRRKLVSIIIPNWNGRKFLRPCLESVFHQDYDDFEVIVVDCKSIDDSVAFIKEKYPQVELIELEKDFGGPYADNLACSKCRGEYILLLNNDVVIPKTTLSRMVSELETDENCVINPTQLGWDKKYDSCGFLHPWIGVHLYRFIKMQSDVPFYPSLACCLVTKKLLQENPLNENLFLYEDTEWGWRLHLKRIKIKVLPEVFFYHKDAGTIGGTPKQAFINGRTAIATQFICLKSVTFLLLLPILLFDYVSRCIGYGKHPSLLRAYLSGFLDFFKKLRLFNEDRKKVQKERLIGDMEIIKLMIGSVGFVCNAKESWLSKHKT